MRTYDDCFAFILTRIFKKQSRLQLFETVYFSRDITVMNENMHMFGVIR